MENNSYPLSYISQKCFQHHHQHFKNKIPTYTHSINYPNLQIQNHKLKQPANLQNNPQISLKQKLNITQYLDHSLSRNEKKKKQYIQKRISEQVTCKIHKNVQNKEVYQKLQRFKRRCQVKELNNNDLVGEKKKFVDRLNNNIKQLKQKQAKNLTQRYKAYESPINNKRLLTENAFIKTDMKFQQYLNEINKIQGKNKLKKLKKMQILQIINPKKYSQNLIPPKFYSNPRFYSKNHVQHQQHLLKLSHQKKNTNTHHFIQNKIDSSQIKQKSILLKTPSTSLNQISSTIGVCTNKIQNKSIKSNTISFKSHVQIKQNPTSVKKNSFFASKIEHSQFIFIKNIGSGKYGKVYLVKHIITNTLYAIKKISKQQILKNNMLNQFILQIKLQLYCNHPNILKLYGFFMDPQYIYLILEYMEQGTLYEYMQKQKEKKLNQRQVSHRISQLASAILYLHDIQVAHRDIKPENIVLSYNTSKLCDFGWATICSKRRNTYCGTFDYVAPQIIQGNQYDESVDLWCIGILTYELLTGRLPFYNMSKSQTIRRILSVETRQIVYDGMGADAKDLIQSLLIKQSSMRRKADKILSHVFIQKYFELNLYK